MSSAREASHHRERPSAWQATLIYSLLAVVYVLPALGSERQLGGTDYTAAGYMMTEFVSQLIASGRLPSWVPDIMGGVPLFANPGGAFHPLRLLLGLVLPVAYVLPSLFAIHFAVAGAGTYLLLREIGVRAWIAFVMGIAYEFTGTIASLTYAGHDGRFIVAASAPLVLFLLHRGFRTGHVSMFAGAAATLGLALLSFQLQSAYYLLLACGAWSVFAIVSHGLHRQRGALLRRGTMALMALVVAFAMSAINFLPFAGYVESSPRGGGAARGYEFSTSYSMPPLETVGLAVPEQAGVLDEYRGLNPIKLHTEYAGALVVALTLLGVLVARRDRRWLFFAGLALFGLTLAWGGHTPLYRLYYEVLPGTKMFRAPGIAFFVVVLSLVAMSALTMERLEQLRLSRDPAPRRAPAIPRAIGAVLAVSLVLAFIQGVGGPSSQAAGIGWLRFATFFGVIGGVVLLRLRDQLSTRTTAIILASVTVIDLWVVDRRFLLLVDPPEQLYAADDVVDFLRAQPDRGRVWVFPEAVAGDSGGYVANGRFGVHTNYLMHFGIWQVGGEHGNQLQRWNEYGGVGAGNQFVDWHNLIESMPMLSAAGVRYAVSTVDLSQFRRRDGTVAPSGFRQVFRGSAMVFRNENALPRAYLVPAVEVATGARQSLAMLRRDGWDPRRTAIVESAVDGVPVASGRPATSTGEVTIMSEVPDSIVIRTVAPRGGLLVLADNYYPDWLATVDGKPVTVHRVNHTFRGVAVGAGVHEVVFTFRPASLVRGLRISLAVALALVAFAIVRTAQSLLARGMPRRGRRSMRETVAT